MGGSEGNLDGMEAQRPTDVSHDQRRSNCFPMNTSWIRLYTSQFVLQRGGEGTPTQETVNVPEFRNLTLCQLLEVSNASVPMTPETFSTVCQGSYQFSTNTDNPTSSQENILHHAAAQGQLDLVKSIICESPSLFLTKNSDDQLPIHVAANAGCLAGVQVLVALLTSVLGGLSVKEREILSKDQVRKRLNIYLQTDNKGNTALHLALKGHHMETAACLVKAYQHASFLANNDKISPLFLAVEAGNVSLVKAMLNTTGNVSLVNAELNTTDNDRHEERNSNLVSLLEGRKTLVHAAMKAKSTDILDVILEKDPSLEDERDDEGMTCLSFGASIGYYKEKGHMGIVEEILERCPDSKHLLNKQGQNILHIASKSWKPAYDLFVYLSETA